MRSLVSKLIRERRELEGWRQEDLADRLSVSRNTIGRWEAGEFQPSDEMRRKLAQTLGGISLEYEWAERDDQHRPAGRDQAQSRTAEARAGAFRRLHVLDQLVPPAAATLS